METDYDEAGRARKGSKREATKVTPYGAITALTEHGAIGELQLGTGLLTESWTYNNRLQPSSMTLRAVAGTAKLLRLDYSYCGGQAATCSSNNGNVLSQKIGHDAIGAEAAWERLQQYGYDGVNRLTTFGEAAVGVATPVLKATNNFDAFGNRWVTEAAGWSSGTMPAASTNFDANNRLAGVVYDAAGNQEGISPHTGWYDTENRLRKTVSPVMVVDFEYDADGRRVRKLAQSQGGAPTEVRFVYDAFGQLAAEYGGGDEAGLRYLTTDHLGSTRLVTDGSGAVVRRYDYEPFGQALLAGEDGRSAKYAATGDPLRFTGKERDMETGLDYFGARYLSSAQGRFTSPDAPFADQHPSDPQSWNLYSYVRNSPVVFVDRTGRAIELLGSEEDRNKAIGALRNAVGEEAGRYLYVNEVTDNRNGSTNTRYFVGILTNGPDGESASFSSVNNVSASLQDVVDNKSVATLRVVPSGTQVEGNTIAAGSLIRVPFVGDIAYGGVAGLTIVRNGTYGITMLDPTVSQGQISRDKMSNGQRGSLSPGAVVMHELGHIRTFWQPWPQGQQPTSGNSDRNAVRLENQVRQRGNPNAATRLFH